MFYPDSDGYVRTAPGPDHGAVVCWQQGLPLGWELSTGDRAGRLADDLRALFDRLVLEQDPWVTQDGTGTEMRNAVDELESSGDRDARSAAVKLRCDPAEEIRSGLSPLDVALLHRASTVIPWLLDHGVPVENPLRVGAHAVDLDLARNLLARGASVDAGVVTRASQNEEAEVVHLLSRAVQPDGALARLGPRLRMPAAQAALAADRMSAQSDRTAAEREQRRSSVLTELADRFAPGHRP